MQDPMRRLPPRRGEGTGGAPLTGRLILLLSAAWLLCFLWSFVDLATSEAIDSTFSSKVNRFSGFLAWQVAAVLLAGGAFVAGWLQPSGLSGRLRRLTRLPLYLNAFLWVLIVIAGMAFYLMERVGSPIQ